MKSQVRKFSSFLAILGVAFSYQSASASDRNHFEIFSGTSSGALSYSQINFNGTDYVVRGDSSDGNGVATLSSFNASGGLVDLANLTFPLGGAGFGRMVKLLEMGGKLYMFTAIANFGTFGLLYAYEINFPSGSAPTFTQTSFTLTSVPSGSAAPLTGLSSPNSATFGVSDPKSSIEIEPGFESSRILEGNSLFSPESPGGATSASSLIGGGDQGGDPSDPGDLIGFNVIDLGPSGINHEIGVVASGQNTLAVYEFSPSTNSAVHVVSVTHPSIGGKTVVADVNQEFAEIFTSGGSEVLFIEYSKMTESISVQASLSPSQSGNRYSYLASGIETAGFQFTVALEKDSSGNANKLVFFKDVQEGTIFEEFSHDLSAVHEGATALAVIDKDDSAYDHDLLALFDPGIASGKGGVQLYRLQGSTVIDLGSVVVQGAATGYGTYGSNLISVKAFDQYQLGFFMGTQEGGFKIISAGNSAFTVGFEPNNNALLKITANVESESVARIGSPHTVTIDLDNGDPEVFPVATIGGMYLTTDLAAKIDLGPLAGINTEAVFSLAGLATIPVSQPIPFSQESSSITIPIPNDPGLIGLKYGLVFIVIWVNSVTGETLYSSKTVHAVVSGPATSGLE